jgi:3-phenylpropionate/cinnamic acid dioxygenase small subunit
MDVRELSYDAQQFLLMEAELLDAGRYQEWLKLLSDDIAYRIPIRITRERHAPSPFSDQAWHMNEDYASLAMRVARMYTEYNWAEDPPSRTRHFLTNFRVVEVQQEKEGMGKELTLKCNVLLFRTKFDIADHALLSGQREDVVRRTADGGWMLVRRTVLLDHTTIGMSNLGFFL